MVIANICVIQGIKYQSLPLKSLKEAREWVNNEIKNKNVSRIDITTITYNNNGAMVDKKTRYYYGW